MGTFYFGVSNVSLSLSVSLSLFLSFFLSLSPCLQLLTMHFQLADLEMGRVQLQARNVEMAAKLQVPGQV